MINWRQRYRLSWSIDGRTRVLKRLLLAYVLLWLLEGALRKWVWPQYAAPLVVIRDPIALVALCYALVSGYWRLNFFIGSLWAIAALSFVITLGLEVPPLVALIGLRTLALHFPIIFIAGQVFTREDVDKIGNLLLDLALPMSILMAMQFLSPADAWLNRGAGLEAAQIAGTGGKIRAAGVFSYISGPIQYYSLVTAFALHRLVARERYGALSMLASAVGTTIAVSVAISRGLAAAIGLVVLTFLMCTLRVGLPLRKWLLLAIAIAAMTGIILSSSVVAHGLEAFASRWEEADRSEQSFMKRALQDLYVPGEILAQAGARGYGIGVGTNMGAALILGYIDFVLAEREWERVMLEMGVPLGSSFIVWRIALLVGLARQCIKRWHEKHVLPLLLLSACGLPIIIGQTGQPATLGFVVIGASLVIASAKNADRGEANAMNMIARNCGPHMRRRTS